MHRRSISIVFASIMISACASTHNESKLSTEEKTQHRAEIQLEQAQANESRYRALNRSAQARAQVKASVARAQQGRPQ
jgi:hypothetical protein